MRRKILHLGGLAVIICMDLKEFTYNAKATARSKHSNLIQDSAPGFSVPHTLLGQNWGREVAHKSSKSASDTHRTNFLSHVAQPRTDRYSDLSWAEFTEHDSAWHCPLSGFILLSPLSGTFKSCREFPSATAGEKLFLPTPWGTRAKLAAFHSWKKKQPLEQMAGSKEWCWKQSFKAI